jgi:hypothetical protein
LAWSLRSCRTSSNGPQEAPLLYDLETATPVGVQRTAELFWIVDGKVAAIWLLFDTAPWKAIFE